MAGPTEKCNLSELCYPETLNVPLPTQIYIYSKLRKNYLLGTGFKLPDLIGCESKVQVVVSPTELVGFDLSNGTCFPPIGKQNEFELANITTEVVILR